MFCNTPGNGAADESVLLDQLSAEQISADSQKPDPSEQDSDCKTHELGCRSGYCETDWKPGKNS